MDSKKYIGMDVHKESISIAIRNAAGKIVMECVVETKASMILQFIDGLRGDLWVTFEEGTWAAWLYDLLKPHVTEVVVCNPRKNALLKEGSKGDKIDARKLAELLRLNNLTPVYHGENGIRTLKELARSYLTISKDSRRCIEVGPFRVPAMKCMHQVTVRNGSARSGKPGCGGALNITTSNSMCCGCCARRCGAICWRKARNTRRGNCCARFRGSVRSVRPC
jgi:hypothetical protein